MTLKSNIRAKKNNKQTISLSVLSFQLLVVSEQHFFNCSKPLQEVLTGIERPSVERLI